MGVTFFRPLARPPPHLPLVRDPHPATSLELSPTLLNTHQINLSSVAYRI
ncbi:uncharacterized protein LACBIDRAFT_312511 [Laccaria bicolor S238N-H82]|uniref:Predicted protein n=1 Tax=Laccaria bicolor (strain S238N-H82 / ATCC MYA-4686) TaxID=486041 RepID=B0DWB6_LACBS|nr:uncharacterized protein LACBIDRAFT_312511 [Laccaria bicolor S238N-H82]EDR01160.1 predicted protein [Laccaria bicolor S238N-H82]|eukprot:XP_001888202.1 predicted protein [Laccaria bicolor S238N-H82]